MGGCWAPNSTNAGHGVECATGTIPAGVAIVVPALAEPNGFVAKDRAVCGPKSGVSGYPQPVEYRWIEPNQGADAGWI